MLIYCSLILSHLTTLQQDKKEDDDKSEESESEEAPQPYYMASLSVKTAYLGVVEIRVWIWAEAIMLSIWEPRKKMAKTARKIVKRTVRRTAKRKVERPGHGSMMVYVLLYNMGVSENSVPLNPMVNDHYPYWMTIIGNTNPYFYTICLSIFVYLCHCCCFFIH